MGRTWVLAAPDGPHVGPINLAIRAASSCVGPLYHRLSYPPLKYSRLWWHALIVFCSSCCCVMYTPLMYISSCIGVGCVWYSSEFHRSLSTVFVLIGFDPAFNIFIPSIDVQLNIWWCLSHRWKQGTSLVLNGYMYLEAVWSITCKHYNIATEWGKSRSVIAVWYIFDRIFWIVQFF